MSNLSIYEQNTLYALSDCEEAQEMYLRFKDKPCDMGFIIADTWRKYSEITKMLLINIPMKCGYDKEVCEQVYKFAKQRFINNYFPNSKGEK